MTVLEEAKAHLATYGAAHTDCCGTPLIRKLVAALDGERLDNDPGLVRMSASEGACYAYPGEDQATLRQAFCDGAVYTRTGKLPE